MQKSKILVVTSFSESGYKLYGKDFLASWEKNWPKGTDLVCYHHSDFQKPKWEPTPAELQPSERVTFFNLDTIPELDDFKGKTKKLLDSKLNGGAVPWQLDAIKFTNKVFALANANSNAAVDYEWIIWLDADTVTNKPISLARLNHWLSGDADVVHLGRMVTTYSETSFVAYRTEYGKGLSCWFIDDLMWFFLSGEFQFFTEWHDGFIFERLLNVSRKHGLKTKNLSADVHVLEAFDNVELGYYMTHKKGNRKFGPQTQAAPQDTSRIPFKVQPKDCVAQQEIKDNIVENIQTIKHWVEPCRPNDEEAIFASGGPSLKLHLEEIKKRQERGAKVFAVKHSYPVLMAAGITPDFCVIIDPRTIEGVSTHGANRKDLFKDLHPDTVFLLSSMTHTSVPKYFYERGAKVLGWHAATGELMNVMPLVKGEPKFKNAVTIGTCSAIRGIGVAQLLGFRKFTLVGYDSSMLTEPANSGEKLDTGLPKYYKVGLSLSSGTQVYQVRNDIKPRTDEVHYWTTGELVALYQDFMGIIPQLEAAKGLGFSFEVLNDSNTLIGYGWKIHKMEQEAAKEKEIQKVNELKVAPTYGDMFKNGTIVLEYTPPKEPSEDANKS